MVEKFTKLGFILAMAGSTVGLGNAWKFPTMTGNNGGSAFILLYLILNFTIIIVAFMAELAIGRIARSDVANSMFKLAPSRKKAWSMSGLFMLTAIFISSFYMLVTMFVLVLPLCRAKKWLEVSLKIYFLQILLAHFYVLR